MEVKGTFFLDFIKVIKSNKDKNLGKWLTPEDWNVINSKIMPSQWYPYETYQNAGQAIFKEVAKENVDITRAFGKMIGVNLSVFYQNLLIPGDPAASVEKFVILRNNWFKGVKTAFQLLDRHKNSLTFKLIYSADDKVPAEEAFAYLLAGILEGLIDQTGAKNVKLKIIKDQEGYKFLYEWTMQ